MSAAEEIFLIGNDVSEVSNIDRIIKTVEDFTAETSP